MYEEPYKWVEAVGNRRQYLDDQFTQGSPVVGVAYDGGILLMTVSKGTPKLYEIYDRLALGGMGHPADLEKLRFTLLEMAHVEGFNRSPSDVTGSRMVKYGLAPVLKQAFEEVFKAPFIVKLVLAELGQKAEKDSFLTVNYDGTFEEKGRYAVLAALPLIEREMVAYLEQQSVASFDQALGVAVCTWAVGDRAQQHTQQEPGNEVASSRAPEPIDHPSLYAYLRQALAGKTIECAVLDRGAHGASKYRTIGLDEIRRLLPPDILSSVT